jgi:hypothetical protein
MADLSEQLFYNVASPANEQEFITYNRNFISNKPFANAADEASGTLNFVTGKPTWWLVYNLRYNNVSFGVTVPTITNNNGLTQINFNEEGFGDIGIKKGDRFYRYDSGTSTYTPPEGFNIVESNGQGRVAYTAPSLIITIDCPYGTYADFNAWEICPLNRLARIYRPRLTAQLAGENPKYFYPDITAQFNALTRNSYIFISTEDFCKGLIDFRKPTFDATWLARTVYLSYGLVTDGAYSDGTLINVTNAQLISPVTFDSGGGGKTKNSVLNMLKTDADGVVRPYYIRWIMPDCSYFFGNRYIQSLNTSSSGNAATIVADTSPFDLGTMVEMPVGFAQFWVAWLSRYGGIECLCFNYLQEQSETTKSKGSYRNMYAIRDLGKIASTSIEISSPFMLNDFSLLYLISQIPLGI